MLTLAFGALALLLLVAGARWVTPSTLTSPIGEGGWTDRATAWFRTDGFFPAELEPSRRVPFSWTHERGGIVLPNLDRSLTYRVTWDASAGRPPGGPPPPDVLFAVDGVSRATFTTTNAPRELDVDLPPRTQPGAAIDFVVSSTFQPGGGDGRHLGLVIHGIRLTPTSGHFRPTTRVALLGALAVAAGVAGIWLCGVPAWLGVACSAAFTVAFIGLLLWNGAFIGTYVSELAWIGGIAGAAGAVIGGLRRTIVARSIPEWSTAAALLLCAFAIKLAAFAHPHAIVGDGMFQVHRGALVHAGHYFFTSVTPRPFFEFPYPVALYVAALPLWRVAHSDAGLVLLLRGVTLAAEALVAFALYAAARRQWNDARIALACAALWVFAPAPLQAMSNANLTNAFGQALFGAALGMIVWSAAPADTTDAAGSISRLGLSVAGVLLTLAFLSHFGTVLAGPPMLGLVGGVLIVAGGPTARRLGVAALVVLGVALAMSYLVYYSHFNAVYAKTASRMIAERNAAVPAASKVVAPASVKVQRWAAGTSDDYGLPGWVLIASAAAGLIVLVRRRARDTFTLVLVASLAAWLCLTAVELVTPLEVRANLAAAPAFVCLAAYALAALASRGGIGAWVAGAASAAIAWDGVRVVLVCLGVVRS